MLAHVRAFEWADVDAALVASPDLHAWRDERGRGWLHLCCMAPRKACAEDAGVKTAHVLLNHGFDIDEAAFTEAAWKATPLWHVIARGRNLALAQYLLEQGADPNHCLFAAAFNNDLEAIRLLVRHGADLEDGAENETPFLGAIKWSHFAPAEELLRLGANVDAQDARQMTALHYMLKKGSDKGRLAMVIGHGARGDIADRDGVTAAEILRRKEDPELRAMADAMRRLS